MRVCYASELSRKIRSAGSADELGSIINAAIVAFFLVFFSGSEIFAMEVSKFKHPGKIKFVKYLLGKEEPDIAYWEAKDEDIDMAFMCRKNGHKISCNYNPDEIIPVVEIVLIESIDPNNSNITNVHITTYGKDGGLLESISGYVSIDDSYD